MLWTLLLDNVTMYVGLCCELVVGQCHYEHLLFVGPCHYEHLLFDVCLLDHYMLFVAEMLYILCYIGLYAGIIENSKKMKIWRLLCRAYAHSKGHMATFALCIRTAKELDSGNLGTWEGGVAEQKEGGAHGNELADGSVEALGKDVRSAMRAGARQRWALGKGRRRTAAPGRSATARCARQRRGGRQWPLPGNFRGGARQRSRCRSRGCRLPFAVRGRTATALPTVKVALPTGFLARQRACLR